MIVACSSAPRAAGRVRRRRAPRAHPMLDLALFRKPAFVGASIAAFVLSASMFSMFLYLTLYIQNQLGYCALESGLRFLPIDAALVLRRARLGQARRALRRALVPRRRARCCVGVGLLLMRGLEPGDDWTALLAGFLVAGGGIGMTNPALATAADRRRRAARAPAWRPASTRPSARSASRPASPPGARSSSTSWRAVHRGGGGARLQRAPGERARRGLHLVRRRAADRQRALIRAAETAFDAGLNHILLIAAIVASSARCCARARAPADFVAHAPAGAPRREA